MEHIEYSMSDKNYNKIAAIEKAIKEKYGAEAVVNPKSDWDENKEKEYLDQMKELYSKNNKKREYSKFVEGREERWLEGWRPDEH